MTMDTNAEQTTMTDLNPDLITIGQKGTYRERKERKLELLRARKINCRQCSYHRGDNSSRKPIDDKYKKVTRDTIRKAADVPEETAEFDVLDTIDPNGLAMMSER